jgi:hypothetical protein
MTLHGEGSAISDAAGESGYPTLMTAFIIYLFASIAKPTN